MRRSVEGLLARGDALCRETHRVVALVNAVAVASIVITAFESCYESQKKAVAAFLQAPGDYFDAEPTFKQSYAPQSASGG